MIELSTTQLAKILNFNGSITSCDIKRITTDSRQIQNGDLFIAVKGEKFDGHQFVADALKQGAVCAIVDHLIPEADKQKQIIVKDTVQAYGRIGAYHRDQFQGIVVGLTGSAGKTTTKEELKFALSEFGKVYATSGNHNNHIGVPQTLIDLDMTADFAIIEMGMSAKGEIENLVSFVRPNIAIITNVYPMHIEFFENFEGIAEAKAEIFKSLKKDGTALINEDTNFAALLEQRAAENGAKIVKFGKHSHPEVALNLADTGEHNYYNAWCVLSLIQILGLDINRAAAKLSSFQALAGRGAKHQLNLPSGGIYTLIDDSYSGQPEAMKIAIQTLDKMPASGRKIVVLGKMAELGNTSQARHIEIGQVLATSSIDIIIGVCPEMKDMLAQLPTAKEQYYFENYLEVDKFLLNKCLQNNDIVLIKGARYSSKMYQVAESLIAKGK